MNKVIIVNNLSFNFELIEEQGIWYLGKNEFDVFNIGYSTDITINVIIPNWERICIFLEYILMANNNIFDKLKMSNERLKDVFKAKFYKIIPDFKYDDVFFTLCNIEYLEQDENTNDFKYILSFNVESKSDSNFFTYDSWNTLFKNDLLIDAYLS